MLSEVINGYGQAISAYEAGCPDAVNRRIAGGMRQGLVQMQSFDSSCVGVLKKCQTLSENTAASCKRIDELMARLRKLCDFNIDTLSNGSHEKSPFLFQDERKQPNRQPQKLPLSHQDALPRGDKPPQPPKKHIMDEKDKKAVQEELAAFQSMLAITEELRKADEMLTMVAEARNNMRSLFEANGQLGQLRVAGNGELQKMESRLQSVTSIRDKVQSIVADSRRPDLLPITFIHVNAVEMAYETLQPDLDGYNKFWHGDSHRVKEFLERLAAVSTRSEKVKARATHLAEQHTAFLSSANTFLQKYSSEVEEISSQLEQARTAKRKHEKLLEDIRRYVNKIAGILSALSGKNVSQFVSNRDLGDGRSLTMLAQGVNPQSIFVTAISTCRHKLKDLCDKCRMLQPPFDKLGKGDINITSVFPKHIICAETITNALGDGTLNIPYSLSFPFDKPFVFEDEDDIALLLLRLLYALPAGKLQIWAIDHKNAGANISSLNALCEFKDTLRIVTSLDEVSPLLRELDGMMGEMTRNVFTYKENTWEAYNASHEGDALPLIVIPIYSMHGFSAAQLDMLQKLLENGPRFGMICLLADVAFEDLEERLQTRFEELEFDSERIERGGSEIGQYRNLLLEMANNSVSDQRIGALSELYANEYKENSKKPVREINFLSLFDDINMWEGNTAAGISATIGWDGAGRAVNFEFGVGRGASAYHALIGGTTGSGKSVFLHTLIQSLAGKYSPEELQLYLLDYKKGDEFKKYADARGNAWLPHVKMISRHKDPRFALELFDYLDKEFKRRSDLFGNYGDIVAYRNNGGKIPRIIVIIDEFQVMFEEYCGLNISDEVAKRLSTIFKQGRSYGIHLVLATQSLASLHFSGMAGVLGQIGLRIALKGMAQDGILADGNRAAENIIPKRQCVVNHAFGLRDSDGAINNIVTDVPFSDPAQVEDCKKLRALIERKAKSMHVMSSCRVFNGAELPELPRRDIVAASLKSENWKTMFTVLLGARTDFSSTPFSVDFTEEQREHLIIAGEDGNLSSDFEVRITGEAVWNGLRRDILISLEDLPSSEILYYNPAVGAVPQDVPGHFIALNGRAKEKELLDAFHELDASRAKKKIVFVENFQEARLLHPSDAPRTSFSSRPSDPQPETPHSIFASLFNGTDDPKYHVLLMTKNFGFMNKEVLARSGAEANILKGCAKRVAFNLSDDDLNAMIPHQKVSDRRGPRRVWFEDMRTGVVLDFLPYGK